MLSNMVPHKLKIRKLTKGQKNEITMCFSSRYIYIEKIYKLIFFKISHGFVIIYIDVFGFQNI